MSLFDTQEALELILSQTKAYDSDGGEIQLWPSLESDLSSDEDEEAAPPAKRPCLKTEPTETTEDGTVWREEHLGTSLQFTPIQAHVAKGVPTAEARASVSSRLQSFLSFISLDMLCLIQEWTVQHARQTEQDHWSMDPPELMAFIAVVILRGVIKVPSLHDSWSGNLGNPLITKTMTRNRFKDIMRHLRFDDMSTRRQRAEADRFAAISELWASFVTNCIRWYDPGRHLVIDEQLFPSKTRCCFLRYVAAKPEKFGIKFWVASDLKSKYICNVLPHLGKEPSGPGGELLSESVAMELMEPFLDTGRNVVTDKFFTSLALARRLLERKTTILGAVNRTCREIPPSARQTGRSAFTTQVFSTAEASLTVYTPKNKKTVYVLSSMHGVVEAEESNKGKPNTVDLYNSAKSGSDSVEQTLREHSTRTGTRRWPVAVFYNMVDMAAHNAHVLYQACTGKHERRVDFLLELARELANAHVSERKARREEPPVRQPPPTLTPGKRAKCQVNYRCKNNRATAQCVDCYKYTCGTCERKLPVQCQVCFDHTDSE